MTTAADSPPPSGAEAREWSPAPRSRRFDVTSRVLRVVGIGALLVPITVHATYPFALGDESLGAFTLVVGSAIPRLVDLVALCTLAGLGLVVSAPFVGSWPADVGWRLVARIVSPMAIILTVLAALWAWLLLAFGQAGFAVVGEPSPSGCRVVVAQAPNGFHHETSAVGVVTADATIVEWQVRNITTDLGDFVLSPDLEVQWDGGRGTLALGAVGHGAEPFDAVVVACP